MAKKSPHISVRASMIFMLVRLAFLSFTYLTLCKCKELGYLAGYQEPSNLARR